MNRKLNHIHNCPKHGKEYCSNENNDPERAKYEIHFCMQMKGDFNGWYEKEQVREYGTTI